MTQAQRPVGVFDSGVGGLSVLRALQAALPNEQFVYLADSANAPYGERGDAYVAARTHAITQYLREQHHIKALVLACNTATAAAIHEVRINHPDMPVVGLEPAIKPALSVTRTGRVGVIGTRGTLTSAKFGKLLTSLAGQADFVVQPCDGLAHAIERSVAIPQPGSGESPHRTTSCTASTAPLTETAELCERYLRAMGAFGNGPGQIDTLVLGCTHYVFVAHELRALVGPEVQFIETGEPVARQTRRLLETAGLLYMGCNGEGTFPTHQTAPQNAMANAAGSGSSIRLLTTGSLNMLQAAALRWLSLSSACCTAVSVP